MNPINPASTALLLVDMQNDFIHPDGAYARAGASSAPIAAIVPRLREVAIAARSVDIPLISTHFTLVEGRGGEPMIAEHLRTLRPFLGKGDFLAGGWGHDVIDALKPVNIKIEKVAYSAFYMSRLEWVLRKLGIDTLLLGGIVTNGGVASTVRHAHVLDFHTVVLQDGCASFDPEVHTTNIQALASVAEISGCQDACTELIRYTQPVGRDTWIADPPATH